MTKPPGSAAPDTPLRLRRPAFAFALLGLLLIFALSACLIVWAVSGFSAFHSEAFVGLVWPSSIGAGLAAGSIGGRLRRFGAITRRDAAIRGAAAFAAAGLAWTLSFGLFPLADGNWSAFVGALDEVVFGALIGAVAGGISALAASYACMTRF